MSKTFSELYAGFTEGGRGYLLNISPLPVCPKCGIQIFHDVEEIESNLSSGDMYTIHPVSKYNYNYYKAWLIETGDLSMLLCYKHYKEDISKDWERVKRAELIANDTSFRKYQQMNIPKRFWGCSFSNMAIVPQQKKMIEVTKEFIYDNYSGTILLASKQRGFGKTHLASCMAVQYWIDNGGNAERNYWKDNWSALNSDVLFLNETDLYFMIRATYRSNALYDEYNIYEQLTKRTKFLILDDIFFVSDREFIKSVITRLIHARCDENMLPLMVTSNRTLDVLQSIDPSLYSRLVRGRIVNVNPKDNFKDLRKGL